MMTGGISESSRGISWSAGRGGRGRFKGRQQRTGDQDFTDNYQDYFHQDCNVFIYYLPFSESWESQTEAGHRNEPRTKSGNS